MVTPCISDGWKNSPSSDGALHSVLLVLLAEGPLFVYKLPVVAPSAITVCNVSKVVSVPDLGLGVCPPPGLGAALRSPPLRAGELSNVYATLAKDETRSAMSVRPPSHVPLHNVGDDGRQMERDLAASRAARTAQSPTEGNRDGQALQSAASAVGQRVVPPFHALPRARHQAPRCVANPLGRELPVKAPPPERLQTPLQQYMSPARLLYAGTSGQLGDAMDVYLSRPGDVRPSVRNHYLDF